MPRAATSSLAAAKSNTTKRIPSLSLKPSRKAMSPSAAPSLPMVTFALDAPLARAVSVCGEFNDWSPTATPMKREAGGCWAVRVELRPGRHQYKFVVDGEWRPDPQARENVADGHGALNSVIELPAGSGAC